MQTYQEFVEKSQKLHKLEEDADYSKRYKEFQGMITHSPHSTLL